MVLGVEVGGGAVGVGVAGGVDVEAGGEAAAVGEATSMPAAGRIPRAASRTGAGNAQPGSGASASACSAR